MPIPYEDLILLGDLLARQPDAKETRRFPSVAALIKSGITNDPLVAAVARLLWKKDWAYAAVRGNYPEIRILDRLPSTRRWAFGCLRYPKSVETRREALNELLGYYGIEDIRKCWYEGRGENRQLVNSNMVVAYYLNGLDPYTNTLIFPVNSGTPYIGCWGDHPEVNK